MEVNINNIEEQILMYVDGELSTGEAKALLQYIALHPEWRNMLDAYSSLVIQPDEDIVFEGKSALLQPEEAGTGQVIAFKKTGSFKKVRWAAAAVLLIGAGLTWMLSRNDQGITLPDTAGLALQPRAGTAAQPTRDTVTHPAPAPYYAAVSRPATPVSVNRSQQEEKTEEQPYKAPRKADPIMPIESNNLAALAVEEQPVTVQEIQRPGIQAEPEAEALAINPQDLPAWLPVSGEKLDGVNDLVAHIKTVKEKVAAKAAQLKKSTFVLRFGEKEIVFGK